MHKCLCKKIIIKKRILAGNEKKTHELRFQESWSWGGIPFQGHQDQGDPLSSHQQCPTSDGGVERSRRWSLMKNEDFRQAVMWRKMVLQVAKSQAIYGFIGNQHSELSFRKWPAFYPFSKHLGHVEIVYKLIFDG